MYLRALKSLWVRPCDAVVIDGDMQLDVLLANRLGINAMFLDRDGERKGQTVAPVPCQLNEAGVGVQPP